MTESEIKYIKIGNLHHHPDNPRKDLGDLTELTDSIKKNGIMQNLTVISIGCDKDPEEQAPADNISTSSDFFVLIGNRRFEAAMAAGLKELPCRIVSNMSKSEQLAIMLEENMQRNDLTVIEEAKGFQMMLDLGSDVETIKEKTGFSDSTIRHRIKLNELDDEILEDQMEKYQFTLTDLYELEKVDDQGEKNRILKQATNGYTIKTQVEAYLRDKRKKKNIDIAITYLKGHGVKEYTDNRWWDGEQVGEIDLDKDDITSQLEDLNLDEGDLFYRTPDSWSTWISIKDFSQDEAEEDVEEHEETEKERFERLNRERKNTLKGKIEELNKWRKNYMAEKISGEANQNPFEKTMSAEGKLSFISEILNKAIEQQAVMDPEDLLDFTEEVLRDRGRFPEDEDEDMIANEVKEHLESIPEYIKLLTMLFLSREYNVIYSEWKDEFNPQTAGHYSATYKLIERLGLPISDEEKELLEGTHELYKAIVPEEENE